MGTLEVDVLVLGSGLAGSAAAICARRRGRTVCLLSEGPTCSGSSFSGRTWGLGFVTPGGPGPASLAREVSRVGRGMNDPRLTAALCEGAEGSVAFLESLGARLETPRDPGQREFVPCFDSRARSWHGFLPGTWAPLLREALEGEAHGQAAPLAPVALLPRAHALSLLADAGGRVSGCLAIDGRGRPVAVLARQTVVACGGYAGLWGSHLCADEDRGVCHALAADAGARLSNLEFVQLMLGADANGRLVVHNEKGFRWTRLTDAETGRSVFSEMGVDEGRARSALEAHAGHGPFTSRLPSSLVEVTLARFREAHPGRACVATLDEGLLGQGARPEFVESYLAWLRDSCGVPAGAPLPLRECAHSCNGGVAIDVGCHTAVPGLLACGEAACGVHGADRIGGLASVTAVTFGRIAGETAAAEAGSLPTPPSGQRLLLASPLLLPRDAPEGPAGARACAPADERGEGATGRPDLESGWRAIGRALDAGCLAVRTDEGLRRADEGLSLLQGALEEAGRESPRELGRALAELDGMDARRLREAARASEMLLATRLARAVASAMRARTESRGSHFRADFPAEDPAQARPAQASWGVG